MNEIISKIKSREAKIGVIGLGYVGLPLVLEFLSKGFHLLGIDVDKEKIERINNGDSCISHISSELVKRYINKELTVSSDIKLISKVDIIILCLPTPLDSKKEPDMSYVFNTIKSIVPYLKKGHSIILESTTYPGTTSEDILKFLQKSGLKVGEEIFLIYSPEREDPGNKNFSTATIPKIVSGHTPKCLKIAEVLYGAIVEKVISVSSTKTAELTKLLENIHRAVNIGLVNEMKIVAEELGIDIYEVIDAASTKPFGFTAYYPGPGIGGHCIPIDPFYLTWKAKQIGIHTKFIELAGEINNLMPHRVVKKAEEILNDSGSEIKDSEILILGLAYKKDVDDMRESPSITIMELLEEKGAKVNYSDPLIKTFPKTRDHHIKKDSVEIEPSILENHDLVILVTDHSSFNYKLIEKHSRAIVDTRGVYRNSEGNHIKRA